MPNEFLKEFFSGWVDKKPTENLVSDTGEKNNDGDMQVEVASATKTVANPRFSVSLINTDQPDPKYLEHIQNVLEENNIEGIDYFEFAEAVRTAISSGKLQDEAFKVAFSMLKVVDKKLTPTLLQNTAQQYVQLISSQKKEFDTECDSIINEAKNTAGKQIKEIESQENNLNEEEGRLHKRLEEIQAERTKAQNLKASLESQIITTEQEQGARKTKMAIAMQTVVKVIEGDMGLIATYLVNQ